MKITKEIKNWIQNGLAFTTAVADRWDPLVSDTAEHGGAARLTRLELDGGEFAGGNIFTT